MCVFTATKLLRESEICHDLELVNATEFLCATDSAKNPKNRIKLHVLDSGGSRGEAEGAAAPPYSSV